MATSYDQAVYDINQLDESIEALGRLKNDLSDALDFYKSDNNHEENEDNDTKELEHTLSDYFDFIDAVQQNLIEARVLLSEVTKNLHGYDEEAAESAKNESE